MGELPIFTCQAHVFTINPQTKKSWIPSSTKAVDVNFFYDSIKHCYRIISVEDSTGSKKVIINSTLTDKMAFKKTSQKFGQWADPKTGGVHGLGFSSEADLIKFVNQFKQCVDAMKGQSVNTTEPMSMNTGSATHGLTDPMSLQQSDGSTLTNGQVSSLSMCNSSPLIGNAMSSINHNAPNPPSQIGDMYSNQSLQNQLLQAQSQVRKLEMELNNTKQQLQPIGNGSTYPNTWTDSGANPSLPDVSDVRDVLGSLDLDHIPGSLNQNDWNISTQSISMTGNTKINNGTQDATPNNSSIHNYKPFKCIGSSTMSPPTSVNQSPLVPPALNRPFMSSDRVTETVRGLHLRLGNVLKEALDLHTRLGTLLYHKTPGGPPG